MSARARPWMKMYWSDWRSDPKLRSCSIAARGLWAELIALMHESDRYGHLLVNGKPLEDAKLAALTGVSPTDLGQLMKELEAEGVFSRDRNGTIYSKRMVRDDKKAATAQKNGARGGNPSLSNNSGNSALDNHRSSREKRPQFTPRDQKPDTIDHTPNADIPPVFPQQSRAKTEIPFDWEWAPFGADTAAGKIVSRWTVERFDRELESFRAHHRRKRSRYSDWQDAWGTWVRNAKGFDERNDRVTQAAEPLSLAEIILRDAELEEAYARTPETQSHERGAARGE